MAADDHGPVVVSQGIALLALLVIVGVLLGVHGTWLTVALASGIEIVFLVCALYHRDTQDHVPGYIEKGWVCGSFIVAAMWFVVLLRNGISLAMSGLPPNPWHVFFQ